jgi:hypothetical protein
MIQGLNETVPYAGLNFHVQTEHVCANGRQQVVSQVFFSGTIVSSRKTVLDPSISQREETTLRAAVREHHSTLIRELIAGNFDDRITGTPGASETTAFGTDDEPTHPWAQASPRGPEAAKCFRDGVRLLPKILEHWQAAARLDPHRPAYRAAVQLMTKMVSSVAVSAALAREPTSEFEELGTGDPVHPGGNGVEKASSDTTGRDHSATSTDHEAVQTAGDGVDPQARADARSSATLPSIPTEPAGQKTQPDFPVYGDERGASVFSAEQYLAAELYEQGLEAMRKRNLESALELLQQATEVDPENARYGAALRKVERLQRSSTASRGL